MLSIGSSRSPLAADCESIVYAFAKNLVIKPQQMKISLVLTTIMD